MAETCFFGLWGPVSCHTSRSPPALFRPPRATLYPTLDLTGEQVGKVCVVDPAGRFMEQWDRQFRALEITNLRSPVFAHPDAYDEEAMLVYAVSNGRANEIHNAPMARAGKGRSTKNARDVGRAAMGLEGLPSTSLFSDFCQALAGRHAHTWIQGVATDVEKHVDGTGYTVSIGGSRRLKCDAVVLALGPVGAPRVPRAFEGATCPNIVHTDALFSGAGSGKTLRDIVHCRVASATAATGISTVLVIGGGLCAAQAALAAHKAGALVTLRSRRKLMTKDYDLNRDWLDFKKFNRLKHDFLSKPIEDRPAELAAAVDGGSVPTAYMQELKRHSGPGSALQIEVDPDIDGSNLEVSADGTVTVGSVRYALVILATGTTLAPLSNPLFANLQAKIPARFVGALPVLTPSLRWVEAEKIFVVGAPGALEIGPGALNLMGGKYGNFDVVLGLLLLLLFILLLFFGGLGNASVHHAGTLAA